MPKITKHVGKNIEDEQDNEMKIQSIKKTEKQELDIENSSNNKDAENQDDKIISLGNTINWLIEVFGDDLFDEIKNNPDFSLPFNYEDDTSIKDWLKLVLKTIFSRDNLNNIAEKVQVNYYELIELINESETVITEQKAEVEKFEKQLQTIEEETDDIRLDLKKSKEKLLETVEIIPIAKAIFGHKEEAKGIIRLFTEAVEDKDEALSQFFVQFVKAWNNLMPALNKKYKDEETKVEIIDEKLRFMLENLKDNFILQRRALLDALARIITKKFDNFDFISPEETLQIDLDIHNTKGTGGNKIKQGFSFAVIRRENKQTYKYADIEVV